jgi:hypothetical protein
VPLVALPSSLWRLAMAVGMPVGYGEEVLRTDYDILGTGCLILPLISLAQEAVALLTLGLVGRWGLVTPRRLPLIGGRPVATWAAVVPAALGASAMTLITVSQYLAWDEVDDGNLTGVYRTVMGWACAPLLLWGPLLGAVTVSYWVRRRR